jgi:serine/threonine protein phosphatase PrpC
LTAQPIRYSASARTHIGQVKEYNQDNVYLLMGNDFVCGAVVDGLGEAVDGVDASRIVVECLQRIFENVQSWQGLNDEIPTQVLETANRSMLDSLPKAGATATVVFVHDLLAIIAHVGDSRAYLIDVTNENSVQLTTDHTMMMTLIRIIEWSFEPLIEY